jgi:hypothetical protein
LFPLASLGKTQANVDGLKASTQAPLPSQWSLSSQRPPLAAPVHCVVAGLKPLSVQVALVPLHVS